MTRDQLRSTILDGIGQMLARPIIRAMMSQDQVNVLYAERTFWSSNDDALDKLLALLPAEQN